MKESSDVELIQFRSSNKKRKISKQGYVKPGPESYLEKRKYLWFRFSSLWVP